MNNIINDLDNYILLYENIYNSTDNLNNYESINNLINFKNKKLIKDIDDFINEDIKNKYKRIIDNIWNSRNEMIMIYEKNEKDEKIKLFGEIFIKNNKDNCFLLIDDKINELSMEYKLNKKDKRNKNIKIKLIEVRDIENMSFMFLYCKSLLSVDMSKWNINKIKNLDYMFFGCSSLNNLSDISKWDTININSMNSMFMECERLKPLPDISKWNTKNIIKKNIMTIIYDNKYKEEKIRIFGEEFVKNNKDKCILLIKNELIT